MLERCKWVVRGGKWGGRWEMGHNIRTRRVAIDHVSNDVAFTGGREGGVAISVWG
jgi:hypothetical protein